MFEREERILLARRQKGNIPGSGPIRRHRRKGGRGNRARKHYLCSLRLGLDTFSIKLLGIHRGVSKLLPPSKEGKEKSAVYNDRSVIRGEEMFSHGEDGTACYA